MVTEPFLVEHQAAWAREARAVDGARWDPVRRVWRIPRAEARAVRALAERHGLTIDGLTVQKLWTPDTSISVPTAEPAPIEIPGFPDGRALYGYQEENVRYAAARGWRALIADEPGLGKTSSALTICELADRWPVVVVVPSVVETHWAREVLAWFPHRTVRVLRGRTPHPLQARAHYYVIGYPVIAWWVRAIAGMRPGGLVVDEAHRIKDARAQQSRAIRAIAAPGTPVGIPDGGPILPLTGTPVLNRTDELFEAITLLGMWPQLGGARHIRRRYVRMEDIDPDDTGARRIRRAELSTLLRSVCMTADTSIVTEHDGPQTIQHLVDRDYRGRVLADRGDGHWCWARVLRGSSRTAQTIVEVAYEHGRLRCTPEHPIWTDERGWVAAGELRPGETLRTLGLRSDSDGAHGRPEAPPVLLSALHRHLAAGPAARLDAPRDTALRMVRHAIPVPSDPVLLAPMFGTLAVGAARAARQFQGGGPCTCGELAWQAWPEAHNARSAAWRAAQRGTPTQAERGSPGPPENLGRSPNLGAATRADEGARLGPHERGVADLGRDDALVCGPWRPDPTARDRGRRPKSQAHETAAHRPAEGSAAHRARVVSVAIHEPPDRRAPGRRGRNDPTWVYDLEVEGVHNFLADGVVVHNCMIRHRKIHVLTDLPPKRRIPVWVDGDPQTMAEYQRADRRLMEYLAERTRAYAVANGLDPDGEVSRKLSKVEKAEALVRINTLREIAARAKVPAALEWSRDYLTSGNSLAIYAHHQPVIEALAAPLGAARITGRQSKARRDQAIDQYQARTIRTLVVSIMAAGVGITLTAGSDPLLVELAWNPGALTQAEDRQHRIGQRDSVAATYLLARDTIDETMWRIIMRKAEEIDHVVDGDDQSHIDGGWANPDDVISTGSVFREVLDELTQRALDAIPEPGDDSP